MGHLINPVRYRLGNSIFWANNWPVVEKTRYFLSYEMHQEMDQYFRTLLHYFRKFKFKRRRKTGKTVSRRNRYPKFYFSNVNVNLFGLNLNKMMVDVNIYDFFLDNYLEDILSSDNTTLPELSLFLNKLNRYVGFEFFFKHKRILQKLTKNQFTAIIKVCRQKVEILKSIAINKLQTFIEIYIEFIRRSLFSFYNDKKNIFNPAKALFHKEKKLLYRLSYSKRIKLIDKYWTQKYSNVSKESGSLLNFQKYFTSEFYSLVTHRTQQNQKTEKSYRFYLAKTAYKNNKLNLKKEHLKRQDLIHNSFPARIIEKFEKYLEKTNTVTKRPEVFTKNDTIYNNFPYEIPSQNHLEKYDEKNQLKRKIIEKKFQSKINHFSNKQNISCLIYIKNLLKNENNLYLILSSLIKHLQLINHKIKTKKYNQIRVTLLSSIFRKNYANFLHNFNTILPPTYFQKFQNFYKFILKYKSLNYQYIKETIKRTATYLLKYDIDPFYQQYIKYKNLKDLYLNINIGIAPEDDTDHDIIDAKFLALYIKRLFKQKKFKVNDLQRTMHRSLSKLPYLQGFVIIFAGRFTRRESKIHKVSKGGILHYGAISKLIDYHTIGFTSKFGYCGIKIFLQYKPNWPSLEQQRELKNLDFIKEPFKKEFLTTGINNKLIINPIKIQETSKKYTRLVTQLFSKNQIPYYYNGKN